MSAADIWEIVKGVVTSWQFILFSFLFNLGGFICVMEQAREIARLNKILDQALDALQNRVPFVFTPPYPYPVLTDPADSQKS
jgi:hypothetical protein